MEDRVKTAIENLSALVAEFDADDAAISRLILEAIEEIRDSATDKMAALLDKVEGAVVDICAGETDFAAAYEALVSAVGAVQKEQECGGNAEDKPAMPAEDLFEVEIQHDVLSGLIEQAGPSNDHVTGVCGDLFEKIAAVKTLPGSLRKKIGYIVETISSRSYESGPFEALAARMEEAVAEVGRTLKEAKRTIDAESKFVDDEDLTSVFLERQQAALNEFESDILKVEKGDAVAALDVATTVGRLAEETSALGMKEAAVFLERLSGLMGTEPPSAEKKKIDALLVLKDILQEHFDALSEGREGKIDAARAESVAVAFRTGQARPVVRTEHGSAKRIAPKVVVDASNPDFPEFIAETRDYIQAAEAAMISLEKNPDDKECLNEIFRCFHNVKGISGFFSLTDVNELSHNAETLLDKARKGAMEFTSECAAASFEALDMLKEMLERVERALGGGAYNSPERWAELINRLEMIAAGQTPPEAQRAIPAETKPRPAAETAAQEDSAGENVVASVGPADLSANGASNQNAGMVKVSTKRLDSLIDAVGELVIANAMVTQRLELKNTIDADLARNVNQLNKITRELQELAMSMRMVSLKSVFQKMARVARDTSIKAGVPMEFSFSGEDTELDRNVVEEISSPLVHMVRNAVDHGIEPSEERMRLGKPPIGKIKLSAFHEGGGVIIRIEDDGRGLDRERIIEKARRLGMVRPDAELSDREAYSLIFNAGFSTAEKVTDISGRGVGMDVVRRNIESLRGRVEIDSSKGKGSVFTIRLPLTLAIIDGMVVRIADENYIVPTIAIRESLRPAREQLTTVAGKGEMLSVRGDLMPLFRLNRLFEVENAKEDPCDALALVLGNNGSSCALMVDDLVGQQQVVIKSLGKSFGSLEGLSGGAVMGDGRVALIVDAAGLARLAKNS